MTDYTLPVQKVVVSSKHCIILENVMSKIYDFIDQLV